MEVSKKTIKSKDIKIGTLVCNEKTIYPYNQLYEVVDILKVTKKGSKDDPYYSYKPDILMKAKGLDSGEIMNYSYFYENSDFLDTICKNNNDRKKAILNYRLRDLDKCVKEMIKAQLNMANKLGANKEENEWFVKMFKKFIIEAVKQYTK